MAHSLGNNIVKMGIFIQMLGRSTVEVNDKTNIPHMIVITLANAAEYSDLEIMGHINICSKSKEKAALIEAAFSV